jgi:phosphocarrier protein HPr
MPASSEPLPAGAAGPAAPSPAEQAQPSAVASAVASIVAQRAVTLPKHLHARPAGQIAQAAARHPAATIELAAGTKRANARSVLAVMALGAVSGSEVQVAVSGPDAEAVLAEIVDILLAPEE